jgi:hypothetical protein
MLGGRAAKFVTPSFALAICIIASTRPCVAQGPLAPMNQGSGETFFFVVDMQCGYGTAGNLRGLGISMTIASDQVDTADAIAYSRQLIGDSDMCIESLNRSTTAPTALNDAALVWVKMNKLWGLDVLADSLGGTENASWQAVSNEVDAALDICDSPNITKPGEPYDSARNMIKWTLGVAAQQRATGSAPLLQQDVPSLRACAKQIGDNEVTF